MALIDFGSDVGEQLKRREQQIAERNKTGKQVLVNPTDETTDLNELGKLSACGFNGIYFPIRILDDSFSHDVASHKFLNRDGELLENTGRNADIFSIEALFLNGISLSSSEKESGIDRFNLYPLTYNKFKSECRKGEVGRLDHPELGELNVVCISFESGFDLNNRAGKSVKITFKETIVDDVLSSDDNLKNILKDAKENAQRLDLILLPENLPIPFLPTYDESFLDLLNKIEGFISSVGGILPGIVQDINTALYRVDRFISIVERNISSNVAAFHNLLLLFRGDLWRAQVKVKKNFPEESSTDTTNLTNNHLFKRSEQNTVSKVDRQKISSLNRQIGVSVTSAKKTIASLANEAHNTVQEIIELNPNLLNRPIIREKTFFRYYIT